MGMFDTFIIKNKEIKCPTCKKKLVGDGAGDYMDFQTKDLYSLLDNYQFPDVYTREPLKGSIHAYTSCPHKKCGKWINALIYTKDNVFCKLIILPNGKSKRSLPKQIIKVPYSPELKSLLIKNHELDDKKRDLTRALEALIFSVYNGDTLDPEKMGRLEAHLKTNILKQYESAFGISVNTKENFFSSLNWISEIYRVIHEAPKPPSEDLKKEE